MKNNDLSIPTILSCVFCFIALSWFSQAMAVDADAVRLRGDPNVIADTGVAADNVRLYTGSTGLGVAHEQLLTAFANPPAPENVVAGGLCLLKNQGDRNCDGIVDSEDLASYAADLGPLVFQPVSPPNGVFDVTLAFSDYLYATAWGNPGIELRSFVANPVTGAASATGPQTVAAKTGNWRICTTDLIADPDSDNPFARQTIIDEIVGCDWQVPVASTPTSFWIPEIAPIAADQVVVLRRQIVDFGKSALKLSYLQLPARLAHR